MSDDGITIRRAGPADATALKPLVEDFYAGDEYTTTNQALARHMDRLLQEQRSAVLVAVDQSGELTGFVVILIAVGLEFGVTAEIEDLYVRTQMRGRRIGSRLMEAALNWCREMGADEVFLVIAQQGEAARQLERMYLGLGFEASRRRLMYRALR